VPVSARDAFVVKLAGEDLERLAVESEAISLDGKTVLRGNALLSAEGQRAKGEQAGKEDWFHGVEGVNG
jgi:hypothetical protein